MKKRLLLLSLMVVMGNLSMGENFKEGTYLGSANGYKGDIKVEVKLSKDKIEDIKVISNTDTPIISEAPVNIIPKKVLQTQGLGVDVVAGATGTSRGVIAAINNAIKSSGYKTDLRRVKETKEKFTDKVVEHKDDVVVIGAGGAGLIAAIEAKLNGANVTVIEKMAFPGGNTLISGAEYAAPENWVQKKEGLKDSKDQFFNDTMKGGDNESNPNLVRVLADNALDGAVWLKDYVNVVFEDRQMFFGGHSVKRSLVPNGASGVEVIGKLMTKAKELGIPVYLEMNAVELITEGNRVVGVKALTSTETHNFMGKNGVIIASGGFGSNIEMRKKHDPRMDEKILSTNTTGITGDGILMG